MISKKVVNAIELCTFLAQQQGSASTTTQQLSDALGLTVSYLEKIIKPLKEHGVLSAVKGPGGGYRVRGDAARISMWDIAVALNPTADAEEDGDVTAKSALADYELGLARVVEQTMSSFALADFVDESAVPVQLQKPARFKFKPLAVPFMPKAPNSVFQLSMAL